MYHRPVQVLLGLILVLFSPRPGLAFEFLWETQGSYVHQMSHLLFAVAMIFLVYEIRRGELRGMPGFRSLVWACGLLALWNVDAVIGHALDWSLSTPIIMGKGLDRRLLMEDWHSWAYYITQITHFLLLPPAMYFFYRSLKCFSQRSESKSL
ncbi:MAG: hypothetical protein ACOC6L_03505 [Thermodesulfobacteriota bacterium]